MPKKRPVAAVFIHGLAKKDVLRNTPECPPVDTLFTLGSPLGIREVQDELVAANAEHVAFPAARLDRWINVYDPASEMPAE